ncbi:MFS transporter [Paenibacillus chitinolyticus]|uniref:MFS transporter n=2 Tax=Paenibacillus chitinolyticus TaxID=79263 RepID=A0ABT4FD86_9BACL|nr:MFS transporter [Paenibacillus chitinolyticus]MCY9590624.1 MFS transporter [Paenibacillus chitinolyticus]MCY9596381.1 MFS transporter [Paenibacillus chitinolyticus]
MEVGEPKNSNQIGIFDTPYRALTIGIMLVLTTVAFEGLAITTIAPKLAQSLQGIHLYGWIFSAFLLSQLVGTLFMGQQVDKRGVFTSMLVSFSIFVLGIVVAAVSFDMPMLIAGRVLQGFGAGALITCVYASVTLHYPDALRTQILAAFSMAFFLPSLIGPYVAGLIASYISWRFVFWIVLPLLVLALSLTFRSFRDLQLRQALTGPAQTGSAQLADPKVIRAILLAIGTGLLLTGLGMITDWKGIVLTLGGLFVMIPLLRKLMPIGTFSVKKGLPATLVSRGLYVACYFATESFVILALTEVKGVSAEFAGLLVAAGSLSWSAAAWLQAKLDARDHGRGRKRRVMLGIGIMIAGTVLVILALLLSGDGIMLFLLSQLITGFGVGLANPTTGTIALQHAEPGNEGEVSATLQFVDSFCMGVSIGVSGAVIALAETLQWGISAGVLIVLTLQLVFVLLSFLASIRITELGHQEHHPTGHAQDKLPM